jgi:asparagine synthase (glutamine-hydrolysing)
LSGIVGIFHRDGAPALAEDLQPLVDSLNYVGPDAQNVWLAGQVGLGRTLLQTSAHSNGSVAPQDPAIAHLHIAADVRLDARVALVAELASLDRKISSTTNDSHLLLYAYALWGQSCVAHLRGDFAFAIWDAKALTLFCARDHFGIKPFYYAQIDSAFIFSNAINTVRYHPKVSGTLNDSAVADFLLFGLNTDNATTIFRDIQRLPPAHILAVSRDTVTLRRYWEVSTSGRIRYSRDVDYIENFLAVWDPAVADRLEERSTGILLSGGLDSAAVAATAKLQSNSGHANHLRAFTIANENFSADRDPQFAATLAASLGIPFERITTDVRPFEQWEDAPPLSPEPVNEPLFVSLPRSFQKISAECRVLLSGEGADNLMHFTMSPYASELLRQKRYLRVVGELSQYAWRRPFPWRGITVRIQNLFERGENSSQPFPKWISTDFAKRYNLEERWRAGQPMPIPPHRHPIHPTAHASLYLPQWTRMFELENPSVTRSPVEVRYPFLDLRVVEYLLAIPPFPWFFQKTLLRRAMADRVPDPVRLRPKSPLAGDPLLFQLQRYGSFGVNNRAKPVANEVSNDLPNEMPDELPTVLPNEVAQRSTASAEAALYINSSLLSPLHAKMSAEQVNQMARPFCFNFWLQSVRKVRYN